MYENAYCQTTWLMNIKIQITPWHFFCQTSTDLKKETLQRSHLNKILCIIQQYTSIHPAYKGIKVKLSFGKL